MADLLTDVRVAPRGIRVKPYPARLPGQEGGRIAKTGTINRTVSPGGLFSAAGRNLKLSGEGARILFVSADGAPLIRVGAGDLADNGPGRLAGIAPEPLAGGTWKIETRA
ncbi:MAG: DUF4469 domain-containing protein [Spirochaetaceae bacterium]|jgi:hypothetical protein|nr:DUF4469 domain-containing protein [Spirochaetaceae bacterium]